jgi:hypothetical protein
MIFRVFFFPLATPVSPTGKGCSSSCNPKPSTKGKPVMKVLIEIAMDDAAFAAEPRFELAWILRQLASNVADGATGHRLYDSNGNAVGSFRTVEGGEA